MRVLQLKSDSDWSSQSCETVNRVKIAHIATVDRSLRYLLLNQLRSIQQAGYKVVGISSPGPEVPVLEAAGVRHIPVPMTRSFTPLADLRSLWQLYRALRRERFTIVHTHTPKAGLLGQLAARIVGVPIVVNTLHGFYFHDQMHPAWQQFYLGVGKLAAQCSHVILSQNREDIQLHVQKGICPPEKMRYLGNGIDLSQFNPDSITETERRRKRQELGLAEDSLVVGFVGRLAAKRKGFLDFLLSARIVAQHCSRVRFLIVGEPDHEKGDTVDPGVIRDYGIWDRCLFLGRRPNSELPSLYAVTDVVVLPSLFEGIPRVVMEASAMGVPAVATSVKGNREAVEHGRNGLVVPLSDVKALANAIVVLLTDQELARRMGEEGRRMALERFDEELVFDRVKMEYGRLLREKGIFDRGNPPGHCA